jgi:predicted amidohydrolase YtcJ
MTRFDRLCLSGLIPLGSMLSGCATDDGPELILHNGNILTVNPPGEAVHARARGDGVILAVAPDAAIMALQAARSDGLDLKHDSVLPRVVVAHKQPTLSALRSAAVEFPS